MKLGGYGCLRVATYMMPEGAKEYATIIIGTLSLTQKSEQGELIQALLTMGKAIIVIAMKSPYDIGYLPPVSAYIATYEYTYPALSMAAKAIFGIEKVTGTMPVTVTVSQVKK